MFRCALSFCRCCGSAPLAFAPRLFCLENPGRSNATSANNACFSIVLGWIIKFVRNLYSLDYRPGRLRDDLFGGIAAAMVMLPISLAYGVLTGLGPVAGIYSAIAVGFFAALFGGARSQISGPTGPMTLATIVILAGGLDNVVDVFAVVALAGLIQILLGVIRSGHVAHQVPESVISGFMTGIGIFVILLQVAPFVGAPVVLGGITKVIGSLPATMASANPKAIIVAGVTLLTGVLWPEGLRKYLPPPLAAMTIGFILALSWSNDLRLIGEVSLSLPKWQLPTLFQALTPEQESAQRWMIYLVHATALAMVGSIDSLMNARMADGMTNTRHRPNRELIAQGIANIAAGLIGGLPGSANTAATVANIRSGGKRRIAGVFYALILLTLALSPGWFVEQIPIAMLAGVLVKVGWDLIDWRGLLKYARQVRRKYLLLTMLNGLFTAVLAVWFHPITAMGMGSVLPSTANARFQKRFPWVRTCRQEHYELSLMVLAVALTVFASLLATAWVGLIFSLTPGEPWQTEGQQRGPDHV